MKAKWIWMAVVSTIMLTSCLEDEYAKRVAEEQKKISDYVNANGFTESDKLPSGVYLKFESLPVDTAGTKPRYLQSVIMEYTGQYTSGSIFETTDSAIAVASNIFNNEIVYGAAKWRVGYTIAGFVDAILHMPAHSKAIAIIPSSLAYNDFNPRVYEITLHEVIENDTVFDEELFDAFVAANDFDEVALIPHKLHYRTIVDQEGPVATAGDSITLKIAGYYAEVEGRYSSNAHGRAFFPIGDYPSTVQYTLGQDGFPLTPGIDSIVKRMSVGDIWEVVTTSTFGYGSNGVIHSYLGIPIVPSYYPVYHVVELIDIKEN